MMRNAWAALCAAGLLALAAPAGAAVVLVTYTGTVVRGLDESAEFGVGSDLANFSFTATYTYDTLLGQSIGDGVTYDGRQGGGPSGFASPITNATFKIGDVTKALTPTATNFVYTDSRPIWGAGTGLVNHQAQSTVNLSFFSYDEFWGIFGDTAAPALLDQNYDGDIVGDYANGNYYLLSYDGLSGVRHSAQAVLRPEHVTVEVLIGSPPGPVAVPEPQQWALMVIGFVGLGAMLRRRRSYQAI